MVNRVALVTGCTSGIGRGIARGLAARGCSVILNGFGDDAILSLKEEFKSKYKARSDYVYADLSKPDEIEQMCREIKMLHPSGVDILVNNAGFQHVCPVEEFPTVKWDAMIAVMLTAPFLFAKHLLPDMKQKGWGRIINISSVHGLVGAANKSAYVSAKHGIVGLTKVVALETAGTGITCNALCPGCVNTPIFQAQVKILAEKEDCSYQEAEGKYISSFHPTKEAVRIDHIADTVLFLCSDAASQMTGSTLTIDGGWTAK